MEYKLDLEGNERTREREMKSSGGQWNEKRSKKEGESNGTEEDIIK